MVLAMCHEIVSTAKPLAISPPAATHAIGHKQ